MQKQNIIETQTKPIPSSPVVMTEPHKWQKYLA